MKDKARELIDAQVAVFDCLNDLNKHIVKYKDAIVHLQRVAKEFGDLLNSLEVPYIDALEAEDNG